MGLEQSSVAVACPVAAGVVESWQPTVTSRGTVSVGFVVSTTVIVCVPARGVSAGVGRRPRSNDGPGTAAAADARPVGVGDGRNGAGVGRGGLAGRRGRRGVVTAHSHVPRKGERRARAVDDGDRLRPACGVSAGIGGRPRSLDRPGAAATAETPSIAVRDRGSRTAIGGRRLPCGGRQGRVSTFDRGVSGQGQRRSRRVNDRDRLEDGRAVAAAVRGRPGARDGPGPAAAGEVRDVAVGHRWRAAGVVCCRRLPGRRRIDRTAARNRRAGRRGQGRWRRVHNDCRRGLRRASC